MPDQPSGADAAVRAAVDADFPAAVAALGSLVRIPSVSFPGFPPEPMEESARAVARLFRETGVFEAVEVRRAGGQPAVIARRAPRDGAPTVLLYAHHDVQPPGADAAWSSPPFEPTLRGDRLHGRGASDDKAGVVTHLAAVTAAAAALGDELRAGIAVFVEGEEEAGSRSFARFLEENRGSLAADVIVIADSDNVSVDRPSLTTSLRGTVTFVLTVSTLAHASHSGMFGGAVPDAVLALVRLLDSLWDADGAVAVAGLDQAPSGEAPEGADLLDSADLLPGVTAIGHGSVADRLWRAPAITVTGIDVTDVQNASNTLLPSVRARLSVRVAPGQRAGDALAAMERHLRDHAPFGAHLDVDEVDLGDPFSVDVDGWAAALAVAALRDGWGAAPALTGIGGSIPFVSTLAAAFPQAQILITGVEDPSTRAHSPDESQHLGVLKRAVLAEALLIARLARRTLGHAATEPGGRTIEP